MILLIFGTITFFFNDQKSLNKADFYDSWSDLVFEKIRLQILSKIIISFIFLKKWF